jgi:hypothetical protein
MMTDLEQFARQHHMHYDVEPELAGEGDARTVVALDVRLFASHGERLGVPECPRCLELAGELATFAQRLVSGSPLAARTEVISAPPALYEATGERDVDEVALTFRVRCEHELARGDEDPCTRELRDRLAAAGVPQG